MFQMVSIIVVCGVLAGSVFGRTREVVKREGVSIDLIAEGRGPLIVLLPSLGRDSEEFDPLAEQIAAAGFRVLPLHDYARDVATVIEHEKAGPAVVAGHAFGHFVAKMTAVDYPNLVRAVVLVAAAQKKADPVVRGW